MYSTLNIAYIFLDLVYEKIVKEESKETSTTKTKETISSVILDDNPRSKRDDIQLINCGSSLIPQSSFTSATTQRPPSSSKDRFPGIRREARVFIPRRPKINKGVGGQGVSSVYITAGTPDVHNDRSGFDPKIAKYTGSSMTSDRHPRAHENNRTKVWIGERNNISSGIQKQNMIIFEQQKLQLSLVSRYSMMAECWSSVLEVLRL